MGSGRGWLVYSVKFDHVGGWVSSCPYRTLISRPLAPTSLSMMESSMLARRVQRLGERKGLRISESDVRYLVGLGGREIQ